MRVSFQVLVLVAGIVACADCAQASDVKEKLAQELSNLASYHRHAPEIIDRVPRSAAKRISVQLQGGAPNAIIAACEDDCGSLKLSLYDYQGNLVTKEPEGQSTVIISGTPQYSGLHELEISVPDCKTPECTIGILVSVQEANALPRPQASEQPQLQLRENEISSSLDALVHGPRAKVSLEGHHGYDPWINQLAFSPDGNRLASASKDKTVRLWDAVSGTLIATLRGHSDNVYSVAFSPDGKRLASASWDRTVRLWDGVTGAAIATLSGHAGYVVAAVFSPDGKRIASASWDNTLRLWDAATGMTIATLDGHTAWVNSVAFSPDGKLLASGSNDTTVRLWNGVTGKPVAVLTNHTDKVNFVAFSPDGKRLASASADSTVILWDGVTGSSIATLRGHQGSVEVLAFSPDNKLLASGSADHSARLWDAASGAPIATLAGTNVGRLSACAPPAPNVYSRAPACAAAVGKLEGHIGSVQILAFSPDGKWLATGSSEELAVRLWDVQKGVQVAVLPDHVHKVTDIAFSPDGKRLASAGCSNYIVKGQFHCAEVGLFLWSGVDTQLAQHQ